MLYLDCQFDPVRLTEHLRGTREPEQKKRTFEVWTGRGFAIK